MGGDRLQPAIASLSLFQDEEQFKASRIHFPGCGPITHAPTSLLVSFALAHNTDYTGKPFIVHALILVGEFLIAR